MVEVYSRPLKDRYYSSCCSAAGLVSIVYYLSLIIAPIFIAYASYKFWIRQEYAMEQPNITFTKQIIIVGEGLSIATPSPLSALSTGQNAPASITVTRPILWSTIPSYNVALGSTYIRQPLSVKSGSFDDNLDGRPDRITGSLLFPLLPGETIQRITAILVFHVQLTDVLRLDMDAMVTIKEESTLPGRQLTLNGDLLIQQLNPLPLGGIRTAYNTPVLNLSSINSVEDTNINSILTNNFNRNETLRLESFASTYWSSSAGTTSISSPGSTGSSSTFLLEYNLRVPSQLIWYIPNVAEELKFAFIQWLSVFWLLYFCLQFIRDFLFSKRFVEATIKRDTVPLQKHHQF